VPAVVGQLAQDLQVHPAQCARPGPVAGHDVERQFGDCRASRRAGLPVGRGDGGGGVVLCELEGLARVRTRPSSWRDVPPTHSSNHTRCIHVTCLSSPSNVVEDGTSRARACCTVTPLRVTSSALRYSSTKASSWVRSLSSSTSNEPVGVSCHAVRRGWPQQRAGEGGGPGGGDSRPWWRVIWRAGGGSDDPPMGDQVVVVDQV
jgi:hypothetical protein